MANEHPYKLRSIGIEDFKSIRSVDINLHPLSVIVGANSSGKSSLLQVILAISQVVRARSAGTVFPLNGEYARFGTFGETVRFPLSTDTPRDPPERRIRIRTTVSDEDGLSSYSQDDAESVDSESERILMDWALSLSGPEAADSGTARVDHVSLRCYRPMKGSESRTLLEYDLKNFRDVLKSEAERDRRILSHMGRVPSHTLDITGTEGSLSERDDDGDLVSTVCDAVELEGAIPETLYERSTFVEAIGKHWWNIARRFIKVAPSTDSNDDVETERDRDRALSAMVDSATKIARLVHEAEVERFDSRRHSLPIAVQMHYSLHEQLEEDADGKARSDLEFGLETQSLDDFLKALSVSLSNEDWASELVWNSLDDAFSPPVGGSYYVLQNLFGRSVKYLGPLRKAPQVLYDPRLRDLDLGLSGEYTAAILHANADHQVVPISESEHDRVSLRSEVDVWLHRFGLATRALLSDRGRLGIGLRITPIDGRQPVDLTSVGVGVSQILPVIVLCLLAEPGDLVILEQPELHLHPALQQQLGDFLLDCANSGRQLLVETHSEHLVNRLRRRVADPSGADEDMIGLIFAEQNDGVTCFRQSIINPYGGTEPEWPEGFFDVSAREAQALVSTSLTKRYRESAQGMELMPESE